MSDDNPREWARPGLDGDPWHDGWDPAGKASRAEDFRFRGVVDAAPPPDHRQRKGRRIAIVYLVCMPIAMVLTPFVGTFGTRPVRAIVGMLVCGIGLIRVRTYGERRPSITIAMVTLIVLWACVFVVELIRFGQLNG